MSLSVRPSTLPSATQYPTQPEPTTQAEAKTPTARMSAQRVHNPFLQGRGMINGQGHQHFWSALQNAGIDPADFKAALQEARDAGARPGSAQFDAIFAEYGIDPNNIPLPQEITRGRPTYNSTVTSEETTLEKNLKDLGIDQVAYEAAMEEIKSEEVEPGTEEYDAILKAHDLDPELVAKIPVPVEAGSEGTPSIDGRQLSLADTDPTKTLDRALPDDGVDLEAMQQEAIP